MEEIVQAIVRQLNTAKILRRFYRVCFAMATASAMGGLLTVGSWGAIGVFDPGLLHQTLLYMWAMTEFFSMAKFFQDREFELRYAHLLGIGPWVREALEQV